MFSTSKKEINELLVSMGTLSVGTDFLKLENYPFEPSIAYSQIIFTADQIDDFDFQSGPPNMRIGGELLFLSVVYKNSLKKFAFRNSIKVVERSNIWDWILEPFLDTEYSKENDQRIAVLLENYGLAREEVTSLREEVETQMLKYNFDTMLWEWVSLDASDVLRAMRTKYGVAEFRDFYRRVMNVALLEKRS